MQRRVGGTTETTLVGNGGISHNGSSTTTKTQSQAAAAAAAARVGGKKRPALTRYLSGQQQRRPLDRVAIQIIILALTTLVFALYTVYFLMLSYSLGEVGGGGKKRTLSHEERMRDKLKSLKMRGGVAGLGGEPPILLRPGITVENGGVDDGLSYSTIREYYDTKFPPDDTERLLNFAHSLRERIYEPIAKNDMPYDIYNCPEHPPPNYPMAWNVMDVIQNWNPDDTISPHTTKIYQGLCVFDRQTDYQKAMKYREAELPFIIRDDPLVLQTVERWNQPEYLKKILGTQHLHKTEYSHNNHFMFWRTKNIATVEVPDGWATPTDMIKMTYTEWLEKANLPEEELDVDKDHWYFRINANPTPKEPNLFMYEELPMFKAELHDDPSFYMIQPEAQRGINCRFGMRGVIAENHFDGSRNFIVLLGGERRYILSHPKQCPNLALYPKNHPSGRHSAVDWSNPDLDAYPQFRNAMVNEVVLQAGDVLYLPTQWFHYIISLNLNYQCNARSGTTDHYDQLIKDCGF